MSDRRIIDGFQIWEVEWLTHWSQMSLTWVVDRPNMSHGVGHIWVLHGSHISHG